MKIKVGNFEIYPLPDCFFRLDGGLMFRQTKTQWQNFYEPDENNRIRLSARCYLIKGSVLTLFDTGMGDLSDPMFGEIGSVPYEDFFAVEHPDGNLMSNMRCSGFSPQDIRFVTQSHLHLDHTGWHTYTDLCYEKIMPTFPNANYLVHDFEWKTAETQHSLFLKSYRKRAYASLLEADSMWPMKFLWKVKGINAMGLRDDWFRVEPGLFLIRTGGHTRGHWAMLVDGGKEKAFFPGDLIPTSKHIAPVNVMSYDLYPTRVYAEKEKFLEKAVRGRWLIFFDHDPDYTAGRVEKDTKGRFLFTPVF